jgi:spore coat protein CotH
MLLNRFRAFAVVALLATAAAVASFAQTPTPTPTPTPIPAPDPADRFFDDSVLHDIFITINSRDWSSLKEHFLENTYYPSDFKWNEITLRNIGIRSRGTGSRSGVKPGLRVDFDRYTTDQKFLGLKSFILRNNTQDVTGMRERLSMLMFRRLGNIASRETHARLYINNAYSGLYTVVESIDKTFLQKQLNENGGHLYEFAFDNSETVAQTPFDFGYPGSDPALYAPRPFKPETLEDDPQGEVLERLFWTITVASDAVWRTAMEQYLDLKKFVRFLASESFVAEEDGLTGDYGPNNFYFYRFENTSKFMFLSWDKSNTFWESPFYSIFRNIDDGPEAKRNKLVLRALRDTELRELYLNTLLEAADFALSPPEAGQAATSPTIKWLEAEVEKEYQQIRVADGLDTVKTHSNGQFESGVEELRNFARLRSEQVRLQVAADRARRGVQ